MKNQNDLIVRIVAVVLALIAIGVIIYNQPQPYAPPAPEQVPVVKLELPAGTVVRTKGLPGGTNTGASGNSGSTGLAPAPAGGGRQFSPSASGPAGR